MASDSLLKRGFSEDIIENNRPTTSERRKTLSIHDSFDEAVHELEEIERKEQQATIEENQAYEDEKNWRTKPAAARPGGHTMYHGQRQHTMFKKLEKVHRETVFDDDDSDNEFSFGNQSTGEFRDDGSFVSGITMGERTRLDSQNSMGSPGNRSLRSLFPDDDEAGSLAAESFVEDESIADFASQYRTHKFPDPDIEGHPVQEELNLDCVQSAYPKLNKIRYDRLGVYPEWMVESDDWKKMKGIIKNKELMDAFKEGSHLRSPVQLDLIKNWLTKNWDMARHLGPKRCTALAKAVVYEDIKTGTEIIKEGDRGYIFYIIIEGAVGIYKKGYGLITTLEKGRFFGERALTSNEFEFRQATVIVSSQPSCEVLVLHKSAYDGIIKGYQENLRTEAYKVLKSVPLFSRWGRRMLERVCSLLERREVPANTLIFKQGDLPDYIYFIVDGNIEIIKEITVLTKNRWPKAGGGTEEVTRKTVNKFKILDIGPGKYFGEIAIVNNTSRAATCQSTEPTVLLALDKFEFLNLLHKGHAMANVYSQTQGYPNDEHILNLFSQLVVKKKEKKDIGAARSKGHTQAGNMMSKSKDKHKARGLVTLPCDYGGGKGGGVSKAKLEEAGDPSKRVKKVDMLMTESQYEKLVRARKEERKRNKRISEKDLDSEMAAEGTLLPSISTRNGDPRSGRPRMHFLATERKHKELLTKQRQISVLMQKRKQGQERKMLTLAPDISLEQQKKLDQGPISMKRLSMNMRRSSLF